MDLSYADLELEVQNAKREFSMNTHSYLIRKIGNEIKSYSITEYTEFKRNIGDLKTFREISDYDDKQIDIDKSQKAQKLAYTVRTQIQEIFNV